MIYAKILDKDKKLVLLISGPERKNLKRTLEDYPGHSLKFIKMSEHIALQESMLDNDG